ncbi:competence protein ComEC [Lactobacillus kalixensis DSM 16043]|uniref:Competence protein ComEC n=1 Tax=Lactobacillus kalixensis DSM 16043 TaxID=1423763 RepID=A0A0R1UD09_9LACO|nr:competence protein ComEC [Lactobacillus kalixensis DSM 16043]
MLYQAKNNLQKLTAIVFLLYCIFLIIKKYSWFNLAVVVLILTFGMLSYFDQKTTDIQLTDQTQILVYPDEVKIEDGWLSGIGKTEQGKVTIAGNVKDDQNQYFADGNPVILSHITGEIETISPATNCGEFDYQKYYAGKKIFQRIKIKSCQFVKSRVTIFTYLHRWRYQLQQYFKKMPRLVGFFASELILAENPSKDNQEILNNYRDLGVIHLLSISGLHVGIYTLVISTICFRIKLTQEETFLCCGLILIVGIFLSNGQPGFIRASLTYLLGQLFLLKKWKISGPDLLGLTCLIHIFFVPRLFMNIGAILSYVLVFGLQITSHWSNFWRSVSLNLLLTPLLLFYFFQVNVFTIFFNMLIVPYFNYVVMPIAFLNILVFKNIPGIGQVSENILEITEQIIANLSETKLGLVTFGKISWWQCVLLLLISAIFLAFMNEKGYLNKKKGFFISAAAMYLISFSMIHFPLQGQVTFIDVGQGDSILITTPYPRKVYMIDTGGKLNFSGKKVTPQVNRITIPFLKSLGINQIDGLFVTHQDADHVGDIGPLMSQVHIKKLYTAKGLSKNPSFKKRIEKYMDQTDLIELLAGMQVKEFQIDFQVVYPFKEGEGKNEDSLSLTFVLAGKRWLFTGDLGQDGEKEIANNFNLKVDYFKLGHHGSKTSSNPEFLQKISPSEVFISAGRNNRFGHPHQETLSTLRQLNIPWVSTQDCGMISWYYGFKEPSFSRFLPEKKE